MKKVHITLVDRSSSSESLGGDTVQINAIYKFLVENGFNTVITKEIDEFLSQTDLIIFFNLTNATELFCNYDKVRESGVPFIIFPIYWDLDRVIPRIAYVGVINKFLKMVPHTAFQLGRTIKYFCKNKKRNRLKIKQLFRWLSYNKMVKELLNNSRFICVNSYAEMEHLINRFNVKEEIRSNIIVIPNGIDSTFATFEEMSVNIRGDQSFDKYICCIGGIGPRKNQLNLVRAANRAGVNLYIIGKSNERDNAYEEKVRKIANPNIKFLGYLDRTIVHKIVMGAKGVIQPSFIETPGLASMEAFSLGIPIAVSDVPPVKEYFNEVAIFVNPHDIDSISNGLNSLLEKEQPDKSIVQNFNRNYNWNMVLEPLIHIIDVCTRKL